MFLLPFCPFALSLLAPRQMTHTVRFLFSTHTHTLTTVTHTGEAHGSTFYGPVFCLRSDRIIGGKTASSWLSSSASERTAVWAVARLAPNATGCALGVLTEAHPPR